MVNHETLANFKKSQEPGPEQEQEQLCYFKDLLLRSRGQKTSHRGSKYKPTLAGFNDAAHLTHRGVNHENVC